MNKLFESRKVLASTTTAAPSADTKIILTRAAFVQYEQILLDKNFRQHLETIMVSKKIIQMGAQKTPIQKTYEIKQGSDSLNVYSLTNEKRYNIDNLTQKHLLYKQFVAWNCNGSRVAPLTDYMDNQIFRELPDEEEHFSSKSDEKIYLDLRATSGYVREAKNLERNDCKINLQITLKEAAKFNLRVIIWAYSLSEYLYVLSKKWTNSKT